MRRPQLIVCNLRALSTALPQRFVDRDEGRGGHYTLEETVVLRGVLHVREESWTVASWMHENDSFGSCGSCDSRMFCILSMVLY